MSKPTVVTGQYVRAHGKNPRGQGTWAFQASTSREAYEDHLVGPVHFFFGTYSEAKEAAREVFTSEFVAVLS